MKHFRTSVMVLSLFTAPFALFACSSDDAADTTVAVVETAAAAETTAAPETTVAPDTTVLADTTAAADTTFAADSTVAPDVTIGTDDSVAPTGPLTAEQVKGAFQAMGFESTDAEVACVQKEGGTSIDLTADEPPAGFIKALMVCAPDSMAKAAAGAVDADLQKSGVTTEEATCFMKSTFTIVGSKDLETVAKLFALDDLKDFPEDVRNEILISAKSCGLTDAQMAEIMAG